MLEKFLIVGTNFISKEFCSAALAVGCEIAGVLSRDHARGAAFLKEQGLKEATVFTELEAAATSPAYHAAYIASPNSLHAAQSAVFLRAGKHVLCEKPAAPPKELQALQKFAKTQNLVFLEAIMYLHTPARALVKQVLQERLGTVYGAHFDFSQRSSRLTQALQTPLPSVFDPHMGGGAWNDLGVYCLYPALDFFGNPKEFLIKKHFFPNGAEISGSALLHYEHMTAALTISKAGQSRGVSQILGEGGTLTIQSISQFTGIMFHDPAGTKTELVPWIPKTEVMQAEVSAFVALLNHTPTPITLQESQALSLRVSRYLHQNLPKN